MTLEGLRSVQQIEVGATVLDVIVQEDVLYISLDAKEGNWIDEFRFHEGEWKKCEMERWRITERVESKVELYYLEMNRKKTGGNEDD